MCVSPTTAQPSLTLASLSSLISTEQSDSVLGPKCISCDRVFSPYFRKEPLYQLPCGHLLCRPCLGEKQRSMPMVCTACQRPFGSQDVLRVHF